MLISPATLSDVPFLCELLSILFAQEVEFKPDIPAHTRALAMIIQQPEIGQIFVAREDKQIIGMVNLLFTISTALGEKVALLEDMVVTPSARGRGVGSALLTQAIDFARLQECKRITLLTDKNNTIAQGFYQEYGFEVSTMLPMRLSLR